MNTRTRSYISLIACILLASACFAAPITTAVTTGQNIQSHGGFNPTITAEPLVLKVSVASGRRTKRRAMYRVVFAKAGTMERGRVALRSIRG
jgi:hypothetical protein